ncbi:glycosyltransferase [Bradyrhizobium sp. LLZ17]|uniref:Glycosyltransferase n=1 Tax=Bradyrhizobium sp. LLZ17 TaxID=3239388 RepID=A0AB39XSA4_9BRAD
MKKVLWICGRLPTPLFSGDALYSAGLLKALAMTGDAAITVVGTRRTQQALDDRTLGLPNTMCFDSPPFRPSGISSLLTRLPRDAYNLGTAEVARTLAQLTEQRWDWIVIDHAYSSGLLPLILQARKHASICYVAHNAEGKIRPEIARHFGNPLRRIVMGLDAEKYRRLENRILEVADAVICITESDAVYFKQLTKSIHVAPPVYLGHANPARSIEASCPRSLLLLGEFEWIAKQKNLELIVEALLPSLKQLGVTLDVVGSVSQAIRNRYAHDGSNLNFHGRVADISPFLRGSRGGLVADLLGGGFKLKVMDYAFERLPIFGIRQALAGTTSEEQSAMFLADDLGNLAATIARYIDDLGALNRNQDALFRLFSDRFGPAAGIARARSIFSLKEPQHPFDSAHHSEKEFVESDDTLPSDRRH